MRRTQWRHTPTASRAGISQVAKAHSTTVSPSARPRTASTVGALSMATIRAPATIVIAIAPIDTQQGGSSSRGSSGWTIRRSTTMTATATYSIRPTDHAKTARIDSACPARPAPGSRVEASTATDWAATTQMNQVPLAAAVKGRWARPRTAAHGSAYPISNQLTAATASSTAAGRSRPWTARAEASTPVPATNVKAWKAVRGSRRSVATASRWAASRQRFSAISNAQANTDTTCCNMDRNTQPRCKPATVRTPEASTAAKYPGASKRGENLDEGTLIS